MNKKKPEDKKEKAFFNRSLERALQILGAFTSEKTTYTLTQLTEIVGLPKATTTRLCSTLVKYNFMKFDQDSMQYSLGIKLVELGNILFSTFSLRDISSPYLSQLQSRSGKTAFLGVLESNELIYLDKKEGTANPIRFASHVGKIRPPYFGMLGQILMAYLPDNRIDEVLEKKPLTALTKKSTTDPYEYREKLSRIREQGHIIEEGEAIDGISGIAAPVYNFNGNVVAAVGVGFISSSVDTKGKEAILAEVLKTARLISQEMGYQIV